MASIFCACKVRRHRHRHRHRQWDERNVLPLPTEMASKRVGTGAELERYKFRGGDLVCAICLENCERGDVMCKLPCEHEFHDECVGGWLSKSAVCPVCRVSVHGETEEKRWPEQWQPASASVQVPREFTRFVERPPVSFAPLPNPLRLMRFDVENDRWVRLDE